VQRTPSPPVLHYRGDVVAAVLGQIMGPTVQDEVVCAVAAEHDLAADRTTVAFRYLPPVAMRDAVLDGGVLRIAGSRSDTPEGDTDGSD
jgi:hypothetical protein